MNDPWPRRRRSMTFEVRRRAAAPRWLVRSDGRTRKAGRMPDPEVPGFDRRLPEAATDGIATPEFVAALLVDGDDDLAAWAIGQALDERPRAVVFDDVVRGAMELVGRRWESGQWLISQEHLATIALTSALARLRPGDAAETRIGPVAVLAAPAGEEHVTGLVCLAQVLEQHGWRVENLGANVPAEDLQRFVASRSVDLVALSIAIESHVPALSRTIDLLRANETGDEHVPILVGGSGLTGVEGRIEGATLVSESLAEAETFIAELGDRLQRASEA